jgi:3-isopropylmalate/(R)-2-methylmalate dehydratase small subunit
MMGIEGRAFVYGDNVNTDVIIPARYLTSSDPQWLAEHCLEDLDPNFLKERKAGDIIVAGKNFGCGSSREQAPLALKAAGVACVVAKSFARIFYRNAINIGLPIVECVEAVDGVKRGERVQVDLVQGKITNLSSGKSWRVAPLPEFAREILAAGGLMKYVVAKQKKS